VTVVDTPGVLNACHRVCEKHVSDEPLTVHLPKRVQDLVYHIDNRLVERVQLDWGIMQCDVLTRDRAQWQSLE
jgi:hypothetical protein